MASRSKTRRGGICQDQRNRRAKILIASGIRGRGVVVIELKREEE